MDEGAAAGIPVTATTPKSFPYRYAATPGSCNKREPPMADPLCSPIAHIRSEIPPSPGPQGRQPTPSPAGNRFMGISSNARNDIYLKTLLNSPYHKAYVPLSATPGYSPAYTTPIRSQVQSPRAGVTSTPQGPSCPGSGRKYVTPKNIITNPFDVGLDDLHLPAYMSPGLFAVSSTPASEEKRAFCWDIEHIAELNPVDIPFEDIPKQHRHVTTDPETEERAQRAIEQFFASNMIAPSPWSDPKSRKTKKTVLVTPSGQNGKEELLTELQGSIQKCLPPKQGMEDASSQTVLTLPVNFDIQKVLSAYMTYEAHEDGNQQDMLSTSSLRRKLFFHGDTSSLAPSPVKASNDEESQSEPMSPGINHNWNAATPLKNTPAFSSSPIKKGTTPQHRRCSSDPEFLASPELSPIVDRTKPHSTKKSRSSGMFDPCNASFSISPLHDLGHSEQPAVVSPIPFEGISPEGAVGGDVEPKFVESPGFSPIRPPKTPIRKIMRRSQEESYIQDDAVLSDEESGPITPVTVNSGVSSSSRTPVDYLSPIHKTPKQRTSTFILKSYSCNDLEHTAMDFETEAKPKTLGFTDNILTSSLCETRNFSVSDIEYPDETQHRTGLSNQDTGYQTASLQSTNLESASLHTNLTNHFNSLPFNQTNQELAFQTSHLTANQDKPVPPILNFTEQIKSLRNQGDTERGSPNSSFSKRLVRKDDTVAKNLFSELEEADRQASPPSYSSNCMSSEINDSALPDESVNTAKGLQFSDFKTGNQQPDFQEEEVILRARQTLAMANTYYPKTEMNKGLALEAGESMEFDIPSPQKHFGSAIKTEQSASEVAYSILQRAGEDLAKFDQFFCQHQKPVISQQEKR